MTPELDKQTVTVFARSNQDDKTANEEVFVALDHNVNGGIRGIDRNTGTVRVENAVRVDACFAYDDIHNAIFNLISSTVESSVCDVVRKFTVPGINTKR